MSACVPHAPRSTAHWFPGADKPVVIFGHRGAAGVAPENTMAAFRVAVDQNVGFELDVTLSQDGRLVVIHDDSLDRTTNGKGFVDETPWTTISTLDAGKWMDERFAGEPVPDLPTVLATFAPTAIVDIEIKSPRTGKSRADVAQAVARAIRDAGAVERCFVTSFDPYVLEELRKADPTILRGQLTATFTGTHLRFIERVALRNLWLNGRAVPDMIAAEAEYIEERGGGWVRAMQRRGYAILAWTVNSPQQMVYLADIGVDGIITDHPSRALEILAEHPRGAIGPEGR